MSPAINFGKGSSPPPNYCVSFEDYLKPKKVIYKNARLFNNKIQQKPQLRLKLLEHPVLTAGRKSKWLLFKEKLLKTLIKKSKCNKPIPNVTTKFTIGNMQLPRFLIFLNARNDQNVCKRKSGFELYCELASIHGFINFVGATTWQRAFWFLLILIAVITSILVLSSLMNTNISTILYTESTQYPIWGIPFPAVTLCNSNRISKSKAESLAKKFQATTNTTLRELTKSFNLALYTIENIKVSSNDFKNLNEILKLNNYTMIKLLQDIAPNCGMELLSCAYLGRPRLCNNIFQNIETSFGPCCSFNNNALKSFSINRTGVRKDRIFNIYSFGLNKGLSVFLDPHVEDYKASSFLTPGFQVFIHDTHDFVDIGTEQIVIPSDTMTKIRVRVEQTYATKHINSLNIHARKCYLPNERKLYHFASYSQNTCLVECRSLMFLKKCHCTLPYMPKMHNWTVCGLEDVQCYVKHKYLLLSYYQRNEEEIICDCYPLCNFQMYRISTNAEQLAGKYSLTEERLHNNHILLRVYINESYAQRLRLDVYENWLYFLGTFGGVTGLFMGYSFLSGFEVIFFVFVRPACNWWSKKQIKRRLQKIQREAEQEKQR